MGFAANRSRKQLYDRTGHLFIDDLDPFPVGLGLVHSLEQAGERQR